MSRPINRRLGSGLGSLEQMFYPAAPNKREGTPWLIHKLAYPLPMCISRRKQ